MRRKHVNQRIIKLEGQFVLNVPLCFYTSIIKTTTIHLKLESIWFTIILMKVKEDLRMVDFSKNMIYYITSFIISMKILQWWILMKTYMLF